MAGNCIITEKYGRAYIYWTPKIFIKNNTRTIFSAILQHFSSRVGRIIAQITALTPKPQNIPGKCLACDQEDHVFGPSQLLMDSQPRTSFAPPLGLGGNCPGAQWHVVIITIPLYVPTKQQCRNWCFINLNPFCRAQSAPNMNLWNEFMKRMTQGNKSVNLRNKNETWKIRITCVTTKKGL